MNRAALKLIYGLCNFTGTTNLLSKITGVGFFLPKLFRLRYANFGGLDPKLLGQQMRECKSFDENIWCRYWNEKAEVLEKEARTFRDKGNIEQYLNSAQGAIAYYSMSAFPGTTPRRLVAHTKARWLFEEILPYISEKFEKVVLNIAGEKVIGYLFLPNKTDKHPMVLTTNGLEGTTPELAMPLKGMLDRNVGTFLMEMPGSYQYSKPLSTSSAEIYHGVIDYLAAHENVDADKIAMFGISFGAHWSARMAALDERIKCAISNGAPLTFGPSKNPHSSIFIAALKKVTGSSSLLQLIKNMKSLSFNNNNGVLFKNIKVPLLSVNGSNDTLLPVEDTILLAEKTEKGTLKLYEGDDHCAMEHYEEMIEFCFEWLQTNLEVTQGENR